MSSQIIRGNALNLPLADDSVDLVVTSPPYFGLRSYQDGGEHYDGQIGAEATPAEFVDALIAATREMVRVVKPTGSIWVNLGDKYNSAASGQQSGGAVIGSAGVMSRGRAVDSVRPKSLIGIPWRYALRCIDDLGLILRAEVIWSKPNGLPESVTDRVRRSHEQWFHFSLNPRYYSAVDEVREEHLTTGRGLTWEQRKAAGIRTDLEQSNARSSEPVGIDNARAAHGLGKLPGSVWTIPTEPLRVPESLGVDHFAAFPTEWPRRIITGWSPRGVCVECGAGRRPVVGYYGPHDLAPVRVVHDGQRDEWSRLFTAWRKSSGMARSEFVPHFPHYKNGDSVTAQFSNWERGKNIPQAQDWGILCGLLGEPPTRLHELAHQTEMRPVRGGNFQASEGARKSGGTGAKQFTHKEPPARAVTGEACDCPAPLVEREVAEFDHAAGEMVTRTVEVPDPTWQPTAPTTPGVVLDPFGGTGTTALVADALGRHGISVDMSADYCRLAEWRTTDPKQRAKAARKPFTPAAEQVDGQASLLELIEEASA